MATIVHQAIACGKHLHLPLRLSQMLHKGSEVVIPAKDIAVSIVPVQTLFTKSPRTDLAVFADGDFSKLELWT